MAKAATKRSEFTEYVTVTHSKLAVTTGLRRQPRLTSPPELGTAGADRLGEERR